MPGRHDQFGPDGVPTRVMPAGSASFTVMPVAVEGPPGLATVSVYWYVAPGTVKPPGIRLSTFSTSTVACRITGVVSDAVLSSVYGSSGLGPPAGSSGEVTTAVFVTVPLAIEPGVVTRPTMVAVPVFS